MLTKYNPMRADSALEKVTPVNIINASDSSSETSFVDGESDDNPKRFSKTRLKSKSKSGSYDLCANESSEDKIDVNINLKDETPNKPKLRKKCYRRRAKKKAKVSQSYSVLDAEVQFGLTKCSSEATLFKSGETTKNTVKSKTKSPVPVAPTYRKFGEFEIDWSQFSEKATSNASSASDFESLYETSCSSTSCGSSTPFFAQPSDITSGVIKPDRILQQSISVVDETMDKSVNMVGQSTFHTTQQPLIQKLPSVPTVPLLFSPDIFALDSILSPVPSDKNPRSAVGPIIYDLSNLSPTIASQENEEPIDARCVSPGRLFPPHFEGKTKNGVYIKSQGYRPNLKESFVPEELIPTENYLPGAKYSNNVQRPTVDFNIMEGKKLDEASSRWMMNRNATGAMRLRQKRNQALSRVKESLGLLLPYSVSRNSRKSNVKFGSTSSPLKKDNIFPKKWFQKIVNEENHSSLFKADSDKKDIHTNDIKKNADYFIKARYNGFESGIIQTPSNDDIFGVIQEYGNESQFLQTTAQVHHGDYQKYSPTRFTFNDDEYLGSTCVLPSGQSYFANITGDSMQPHAPPRKGILKKAGSLDSNENLTSNSTEKRKRNVVTYDLPLKEASLEADYDSIEQNSTLENTPRSSEPNDLDINKNKSHIEPNSKSHENESGKDTQTQGVCSATYENVQMAANDLVPARSYSRHHWQGSISPVNVRCLAKIEKTVKLNKNLSGENSSDSLNVSSISSRDSICSTKASFDSIRLCYHKCSNPDASKFSKFDTIDNFTSNFSAFETTVHYPSKKFKYKSSIPISLRMKGKSLSMERCKSRCSTRTRSPIAEKNLKNLRMNTEDKPHKQRTTHADIMSPVCFKRNNANSNNQESTDNKFESPVKLDELNNYESYCIVSPTTSVPMSVQCDGKSAEKNSVSSPNSKSSSPRRPFRRPSVSLSELRRCWDWFWFDKNYVVLMFLIKR